MKKLLLIFTLLSQIALSQEKTVEIKTYNIVIAYYDIGKQYPSLIMTNFKSDTDYNLWIHILFYDQYYGELEGPLFIKLSNGEGVYLPYLRTLQSSIEQSNSGAQYLISKENAIILKNHSIKYVSVKTESNITLSFKTIEYADYFIDYLK